MKTAIVILNWNGKKLLEQFLPSVVEHSEEASIYVADNASTDDSVAFLKANFPTVKIIQNKTNGGFAKGYNDALQHIDAEIFCLLNNDVEVTQNWLSPIVDTFKIEPNTAIIQPKILDYKRKDYFEYAGAAGGFIDKFGYPFCRGRIFNTVEKDENQYNDSTEIFWASGACLFIRKSIFEELKGLDENFFAHMEEIDLCWRAKNLDYNIKYVGASTVFHVGGATLSNTNSKKTYLNFRNSLFALVKNAKGNLFFLVFTRLLLDGIAGIKFLFEFKFIHILAIIKAHFSFYKYLPKLLKQRKTLQQEKKYYKTTSIVWSHFVLNKKTFISL
ncbi:MAG: glycosyltransferase family 2 protein [Flavobacteriaceae bacterium]|nr:glycosyltransferase family 2 protein [Flavobacteriaceae bacterium]